jgi:hypothetical protein
MSSPGIADAPSRSEPAAPIARRRISLAWLAAIPIALHACVAWILRAPTIATGNDDAVYLLLARALREGHYRELFYVGTPIHSQYPPGYPALLAILGAPADGEIGLLVAANILLSCAALVLAFDVMRQWSLPIALAGVAALALNPSLIEAASRLQSEPLFMAAVLLALWGLRPDAPEKYRWVAVVAAIVAALTRSAGVAIVAGVVLYFLTTRAWRHALALTLGAALTVGPWLTWTVLAPEKVVGRSYIADVLVGIPVGEGAGAAAGQAPRELGPVDRAAAVVRSFAVRVRNKAPRYISRGLPTELAIPTVEGTRADNLAWLILMAAAGVVGAVAAWTRWRAALLVLMAYGGLLLIWPYAINRFLTPLLPPYVALLLLGAWRIGARLPPRAVVVPALVLAAIPLAGGARELGRSLDALDACAEADRRAAGSCAAETIRYRQATDWLDEHLPPDARLFTTKEGTLYYRIGRQVVPLYGVVYARPAELRKYLDENGTTMIFLPHFKPEEFHLIGTLTEMCTGLTDAGSFDDELLMLWNRPPGPGEANGCDAVARWSATWEDGGT